MSASRAPVRRAASPPQQRKAAERDCRAQHKLPSRAGNRYEVAAEHEQERQRAGVVTEQPQHRHGEHAGEEGCRRPAPTPRVRHCAQDQQQHEEPVARGVPIERIAYRRRSCAEPADGQERQRNKGINDALWQCHLPSHANTVRPLNAPTHHPAGGHRRSPVRRTRGGDLEPSGRCAGPAFAATLRDMTNTQSLPAPVEAPASSKQYSLKKILAIWASVTAPMALLAWVVAPAIIPHTSLHPGLVHWMLMVVGHDVAVRGLARHPAARAGWPALAQHQEADLAQSPA